jgi:phosphoribosylformylglycinamidine synthase
MIYRMYRKMNSDLELGFYIETTELLSPLELNQLQWLIAETFEPNQTGAESYFASEDVVEIGPRLSIETPFSSNAVSICRAMGLWQVTRIEQTRRHFCENGKATDIRKTHLDRMTEVHYPHGIESFDTGIMPEDVRVIDLMGHGKAALEATNNMLGLGMDAWDIEYYHQLFVEDLGRNPTDVELFQLGNANSEHSRHWYFKGKIVIDGMPMEQTLFEIVQRPLQNLGGENGSLVAFHDNAGVLKGFGTSLILPATPGKPSEMRVTNQVIHITCTAETHNHPVDGYATIVLSDVGVLWGVGRPAILSATFSFPATLFPVKLLVKRNHRSMLHHSQFLLRAVMVYQVMAISSASP